MTHRCSLCLLLLATVLGLIPAPVAAAVDAPAAFDRAAQTAGPRVWGTPLLDRDEVYVDGVGGRRAVRYYPQGRMELTRPAAGEVTYGRLVTELVGGELAVGDSQQLHYAGADLPVVGDWDRARNGHAPTYRSLRPLLARAPNAVGQPVEAVLLPPEGAGVVSAIVAARRDPALGQLAVNALYVDQTGHNIPSVFLRELQGQGAVGGRDYTWTALYGWPITDAFWARAHESGRATDVMVQLFERRTLVFRPGAPADQQVRAGDVGRAYLAWRDGRANAAPNLTPLPSRAGLAVPPVGEAGTSFLIAAAGFADGEQIDAWLETGGAVYPQPSLRLRPGGILLARLRTTPVTTGALEIRIVARGRDSGHESYVQFRVLATDLLTPGAEAAEPNDLPAAVGDARVEPGLLQVGQMGEARATGFAPGETVTGWITTGLHRVIPYPTYVQSARVLVPSGSARPATTLTSDDQGQLLAKLPAPGVVTGGVFTLTLVGDQSGHVAVAPFRARAGAPWLTNFTYGVERPPATAATAHESPAALMLMTDDTTKLDPAWLADLGVAGSEASP